MPPLMSPVDPIVSWVRIDCFRTHRLQSWRHPKPMQYMRKDWSMRRVLVLLSLLTASALVCGIGGASGALETAKRGQALAAPLGSILVSGEIPDPRTFETYELAAIPQRTVSVVYGGVTHTESGPLISDVMTFLGWSPSGACRNDVLRWWILASNAKGQSALVTRGEIDPGFG